MFYKPLLVALAVASITSASPASKRQSENPCLDARNACVARGTPEVACDCRWAECLGEDNARTREFSPSGTGAACDRCQILFNTCRQPSGGVSANQSFCAAQNAFCQDAVARGFTINTANCDEQFNRCRAPATGSGNQAFCRAEQNACVAARTANFSAIPSCPSSTPTPTPRPSAAPAPAPVPAPAPAPGANAKPVPVAGKKFTVKNVNRYCGEGNKGCDYNFDIEANGKNEHCTVIRMPGSNAATESWPDQKCGSFQVAWGYAPQPAPAFAVLTVKDAQTQELAFFGISNVNGQAVTPNNPFGSGNYGTITEQVYKFQ